MSKIIDTTLENSGMMSTFKVDDDNSFKVNRADKNYIIKEFYFQPMHYYAQLASKNLLDRASLELYKKRYNDDGSNLCADNAYKVGILVAMDSQLNTKITFDINRNDDFTDESTYVFTKTENEQDFQSAIKNLPIVSIPFTYCLAGDHLAFHTVYIRPYPYKSHFTYGDESENIHYLMVQNATSKKGYFNFRGKEYSINVSTGRPLPLYTLPETKIYVTRAGEKGRKNQYYEIGDTVLLENGAIALNSISSFGDTVRYTDVTKQNFFDPWKSKVVGIRAFDIYGAKRNVPLNKALTLLDFWGTWCSPCLALIPQLRELNKAYKSKGLSIVSIAYEKKNDIPKLKETVAKRKMTWLHLVEEADKQNNTSLVKRFKIDAFPTYILINERGDIIFRGEGEEGFKSLMDVMRAFGSRMQR